MADFQNALLMSHAIQPLFSLFLLPACLPVFLPSSLSRILTECLLCSRTSISDSSTFKDSTVVKN